MNISKKKLTSLILAVCMILTMSALPAFAAEAETGAASSETDSAAAAEPVASATDTSVPADCTDAEIENEASVESISPVCAQIEGAADESIDRRTFLSEAENAYLENIEDDSLSLMSGGTPTGTYLTGGMEIAAGSTNEYYIDSNSTGVITISNNEDDIYITGYNLAATGAGKDDLVCAESLSIEGTVPGCRIHLSNVAIHDPVDGHCMIKFIGEYNELYLDGVNLLDLEDDDGFALIEIERDGDGNGEIDDLSIMSESDYAGTLGTLYMYKGGSCAAVGSSNYYNSNDGTGLNGNINFYNARYFIKGSRSGAVIGAASDVTTAAISCGSISFYNGVYNLMANARGALIGTSGGLEGGSDGGDFYFYDGTFTMNVDYSGASIGGGGGAGSNIADGGTLHYYGGSLRAYIDENASGSWGVEEPGVNLNSITAEIVSGATSESLYLYKFDTNRVAATETGSYTQGYDVYTSALPSGSNKIFGSEKHNYYYINEDLYKQEQSNPTSTSSNWIESSSDTYIYLMLPGRDQTLTVNGTEFPLTWCGSIDPDASVNDVLFAEQMQVLPASDTITAGGRYKVESEDAGTTITVTTAEPVVIGSYGQEIAGIKIQSPVGVTPHLILERANFSNSSDSVLDMPGGGTVELIGDSILAGSCTSAGSPTVSFGGSLTITADTIREVLDITAADGNAAVEASQGSTFTLSDGTVKLTKIGTMGGTGAAALSAVGSDVVINEGQFVGLTSGTDIPVIYSDSLTTSTYAAITAYSQSARYPICANEFDIDTGSIKVEGSSDGTDYVKSAAVYDIDGGNALCDLEESPYTVLNLDVSQNQDTAGSGFYTVWYNAKHLVSNRVYRGVGHRWAVSEGVLTYIDDMTSEDADKSLYFWLRQSSGTMLVGYNDTPCIGFNYFGDTGEWIDAVAPSYSATISPGYENQYPEAGTVTLGGDYSAVLMGDTITGTVITNEGYILEEIRYFFRTTPDSIPRSRNVPYEETSPGVYSFEMTMPYDSVEIEAIWKKNRTIALSSVTGNNNVQVSGIASGATNEETITFTVSSDRPCVIVAGTGASAHELVPTQYGEGYRFILETAVATDVNIMLRGDANGDGEVAISDVQAMLLHIKGRTPISGLTVFAADANSDNRVTIVDADKTIKNMYNIDSLSW